MNSFFHFNSIQSQYSLSSFPFISFLFAQLIPTRTLTAKCISSDHFFTLHIFTFYPPTQNVRGANTSNCGTPKLLELLNGHKILELQKYT